MDNPNLENIVAVLAVISFALLLYKSKVKKDISILGSAITRLYLTLLFAAKIFFGQTALFHELLGTAFVLIFIGDIFNTIFRLSIDRQKAKLVEDKINALNQKFLAAVDTSPIPFFTIDHTGIIEYTNEALASVLGYHQEELIGRNLIHILDPRCKGNLLDTLKTESMATCFVKTSSGMKKATILGKATKNGHETITGSIYTF